MILSEKLKLRILEWQDNFEKVAEQDEIDPEIGIEAIWLLDSVAYALREDE